MAHLKYEFTCASDLSLRFADHPEIQLPLEGGSLVLRHDATARKTEGTAIRSIEPRGAVASVFSDLARGVMPEGCTYENLRKRWQPGDALDGQIPSLSAMKQHFRDFVLAEQHALREAVLHVLRLLRWRFALPQRHNPIVSASPFTFSLDESNWHPLPTDTMVRLSESLLWDPTRNMAGLKECLKAGHSEPVAHSLLREAKEQLDKRNHRSALLIGYTALEIGVKSCIASLVPDAEWLAFNAPSPDMVKLLREYFPTLLAARNSDVGTLSDATLHELRKFQKDRNDMAHGRRQDINWQRLLKYFDTVEPVIWYLDACAGHAWARERASEVL